MKPVSRPDTPAPFWRSRWHTLPPDILRLVSKRVRIMAIAIGGIWTLGFLIDNVFARLLGQAHMPGAIMLSTFPGNMLAALGIASSVVVLLVLPRLKPGTHGVIDLGLAFQVFTAGLVALLMNWDPNFVLRMGEYGDKPARISWLCLIILLQPAVVPSPPLKTLVVSLLIATMDPFAVWVVSMAGKPIDAPPFALLWFFLPNYVSVVLAMIPSHIISVLARQVIQARELGSYQLGDLLGKGGMGEVYHARHRLLARPAAIKLIRPETLGAQSPEDARVMIQSFRREAEASALLASPHTINLYDFGVTDEGTFYYVMELLEGFDLDTLVERFGPVPAERAIFLLRDVCHSLGEAHARGLIHRDIKPSNIFTCRLGLSVDFVKVLDFGLVKHRHDVAHPHADPLTQPAVTTGTPAFMAPEIALEDRAIDRRVDIYALGCVGYWLLTGRLVFDADTPVKMMLQHIQGEPSPPSRHTELEVPPELDRILLQCLAKKREDRPSDTIALARMLASVRVREEWTRERAEQWWETNFRVAAPPVRDPQA